MSGVLPGVKNMMNVLCTVSNFQEHCLDALHLLKANGFNVIFKKSIYDCNEQERKTLLADIDAIILGTDILDGNIFKSCPRLKIVSRFGVGVDNINIEEATCYNVVVNHATGLNSTAVAEYIISILLASYRKIPIHDHAIKSGLWEQHLGRQLNDKKVGLVGFGNIAKKLCPILSGFNVSISAYDKNNCVKDALFYDVTLKSLELIFVESDIIIILLPYHPELENIISNRLLSLMHNGSLIINAARGKLLDPVALYDKINEKNIYAALDVFGEEPVTVKSPLHLHPNVIATPHIAAATVESYKAIGLFAANSVIEFFRGDTISNLLN